jgi:protein-L-isoaspartate(D-aspartate) O-methyltransferase
VGELPAGEAPLSRPAGVTAVAAESGSFRRARERMVAALAARGITDETVLAVMGRIPRQSFVPEALAGSAYGDHPLPVLDGQTVTQPHTVALCVQEVRKAGGERVLEVGTGTGYQAAVLAGVCRHVFSVERNPRLVTLARANLDRLGITNVALLRGDGTIGWSRYAPYDAIVVAAGTPDVPAALLAQLRTGGRLLIPLGGPGAQQLTRVTQEARGAVRREALAACSFVPLLSGRDGDVQRSATSRT